MEVEVAVVELAIVKMEIKRARGTESRPIIWTEMEDGPGVRLDWVGGVGQSDREWMEDVVPTFSIFFTSFIVSLTYTEHFTISSFFRIL